MNQTLLFKIKTKADLYNHAFVFLVNVGPDVRLECKNRST